MTKKNASRKTILTIVIGGDMEKDEQAIWGDPEKAMEQPQNMVYVDSYEELYRMLSPARLDLLRYLIRMNHSKQPKSVGTIAIELNRKQEAISRDLHFLTAFKLVELKKNKQMVLPQTHLDGIEIQMIET